jgi:type II secretory pathway component PulF
MCLICTSVEEGKMSNLELAKAWRELVVKPDHVVKMMEVLDKAGKLDAVSAELGKLMDLETDEQYGDDI